MDDLTRQRLAEINSNFYQEFSGSFAETRSKPQPGFFELEKYLPSDSETLLDVGCGEGRLGRFLLDRGRIVTYDGIDGSQELIEFAKRSISGRFWRRDLVEANALRDLGHYDSVACLAVLQHIPGRDIRLRLIADMAKHLRPNGRLLISTWQFLTSERQRKKIVPWRQAGLDPGMLETNDYLLTWSRDGNGLRYVNYIDQEELLAMAHEVGLRTVTTFRCDGREGNLNLYSVHELSDS